MPTHRSNGLPTPHESEGGLGWRWLAAECPSKCEEQYIFGRTNEHGETWKKKLSNAYYIPLSSAVNMGEEN